jgi:phospholipid/cholesterol/gamma-HCH transport system permease protein
MLGGLSASVAAMDIAASAYLDRSVEALTGTQFVIGATKAVVFGGLVALTSCYSGLYSERNAAGVGIATTGAVVAGIVGVIALDAVFAICSNALGI